MACKKKIVFFMCEPGCNVPPTPMISTELHEYHVYLIYTRIILYSKYLKVSV